MNNLKFFTGLLIFFCYVFVLNTNKSFAIVNPIQLQIDNAHPGDTIFIDPGKYTCDSLIINKSIHIKGHNLPEIDGKSLKTIVTISSSNVTIDGIKLINSGFSGYSDYAAIEVINSKNVTIKNCTVENCFFGIYYSGSAKGLIWNNRITSNRKGETESGNGIHLWKCESITILNNNITGHRDGIYLEFSTNSFIKENISEFNIRYGLHFMFSHNNKYIKNTFKNNGAGVAVMYTKNVEMTENIFLDNKGTSSYGLLLKDISDSHISGNIFDENSCAINMEECNRIEIQNNNFSKNGWAIRIQASCSGNNIENNNFIGNTFDVTTNGTMVMNTFDGNYWDNYTGYDLNRDNTGDIPHSPVSIYSIIADQMPIAMILYRSFMVTMLEQIEKVVPSITPASLLDNKPRMKPIRL